MSRKIGIPAFLDTEWTHAYGQWLAVPSSSRSDWATPFCEMDDASAPTTIDLTITGWTFSTTMDGAVAINLSSGTMNGTYTLSKLAGYSIWQADIASPPVLIYGFSPLTYETSPKQPRIRAGFGTDGSTNYFFVVAYANALLGISQRYLPFFSARQQVWATTGWAQGDITNNPFYYYPGGGTKFRLNNDYLDRFTLNVTGSGVLSL